MKDDLQICTPEPFAWYFWWSPFCWPPNSQLLTGRSDLWRRILGCCMASKSICFRFIVVMRWWFSGGRRGCWNDVLCLRVGWKGWNLGCFISVRGFWELFWVGFSRICQESIYLFLRLSYFCVPHCKNTKNLHDREWDLWALLVFFPSWVLYRCFSTGRQDSHHWAVPHRYSADEG